MTGRRIGPIALACCILALGCTILPRGPSAVDRWSEATQAGMKAQEAGDARQALSLFIMAASIADAELAGRGTYAAESLMNLGGVREALHEYGVSLQNTEKALPLLTRAYGERNVRVTGTLLAAGRRAFLSDNIEKAAAYCAQTMAIEGKKGASSDTRIVAESQYWMGRICLRRQDYGNAACLFQMSINNHAPLVAAGAEDGRGMAADLLFLGIAYAMAKDFPRARESLGKALGSNLTLYGEESTEAAQAEEWLGWVSWSQGDIDEAIRHTEKALAIYLTRHTADDLADMYNRLAGYCDSKGYRAKAAEYRAKVKGMRSAG